MNAPTLIASRSHRHRRIELILSVLLLAVLVLGHYQRAQKEGTWVIPGALVLDGLFLVFFMLASLRFADRAPLLTIAPGGIGLRRSRLPFAPSLTIPWTDLSYYRQETRVLKGNISHVLKLGRASSGKEYSVELSALDTDAAAVLEVLRAYAERHGIRDLGQKARR